MTQRDFWRNSKVAVIGGGSWGTVLANIISANCQDVRMWVRDEDLARSISSTRVNPQYVPDMQLNEKVHALSDVASVFEGEVQAVVWALPTMVSRPMAKEFAPFFRGDEILLHATKGIEEGSLKRVSEVLREEIPCPRIGVISGPNLAAEVARREPAGTVVASVWDEVIDAGQALLTTEMFRIYGEKDVIGVEWAGTLKNIFAIASGALDAMKFGWNSRALLLTMGLTEMVRFGVAMGAKESTFLGLAGVGDLIATCSSPLSRNYRVGFRLAQGDELSEVLEDLGGVAEGIRTAQSVWAFASSHGIVMPITEAVCNFLGGKVSAPEAVRSLMTRN